jgi:hypothetical protein
MPPTHATNSLVLGRALLVARVASIDGEPIEIPLTQGLYRAMLFQVGKEGLAAAMSALTPTEGEDTTDLAKN